MAGCPAEIDGNRIQVELLRLPTEFTDRYVVLDVVTGTDTKAFIERLLAEVA